MNNRKAHSDSIANIIQKFESFQHTSVNIEDMPPRPITAPPKLNGNNKSLVQRFAQSYPYIVLIGLHMLPSLVFVW